MYKYITDLVLGVDAVLLVCTAVLLISVVIYSAAEDYFYRKRVKALVKIKNYLYEQTVAGEKKCPIQALYDIAPSQFLDVVTNRYREVIFFNLSEQRLFTDCFISQQKLSRLENIARSHGDKWRRIEAMLCLGYARVQSSVDIFKRTVFDKDKDLSYFSIIALGQIKTISSARILVEFLCKKYSYRYKIVATLETFPPVVADEIAPLLKSEDPFLRSSALKLTSRFKSLNYREDVEAMALHDSSDNVRSDACESLGNLGLAESRDTLIICLKDDFWQVRSSAVEALSKISHGRSIPDVIGLMNDGSLSVIDSVRNVMGRHIKESLPYIEGFLRGNDAMAKKISLEALEESGYILELFKNILAGNDKDGSIHFLELVIKSGSHFGLEAAMLGLDGRSRKDILKVISSFNTALAEHIEKKLEHKIAEI